MENYEKKYKEALEWARKVIQGKVGFVLDEVLEKFPELKERGDESVKKKLLSAFKGIMADADEDELWYGLPYIDIIAWLEKQGEQEETICDKCKKEHPSHSCQDITALGRCAIEHEHKPTDKVEPKFHEGDLITNGKYTWKVIQVDNLDYTLQNQWGHRVEDTIDFVNKEFHLWTIQDAKDGNILTESKGDVIFIFRGIGNTEWDDVIDYHCYYDCYRKCLIVQEDVEYWGNTKNTQLKPATKEQRELLFVKMKEAGYDWNAEQKELKKIVPIFNVGDTIIKKHNSDINDFGQFTITDITGGKYWYNDRIICDITEQDDWEIYEPVRQKPAWSEEDERLCKCLIKDQEESLDNVRKDKYGHSEIILDLKDTYQERIEWLKSIKDRVQSQPKQEWSEEDAHWRQKAIELIEHPVLIEAVPTVAKGIIEWLKSLKE